MTRCNGRTQNGNKCRSTATDNGYCRWHKPTVAIEDCAVCYEPFEANEAALPCGHWVHRSCVQKGADALQETRAKDGYPPIRECTCPVCRAPLPDMKPKDPPPVPALVTNGIRLMLGDEDLNHALYSWQQSNYVVPLRWYIWGVLCEKYPDKNPDELMLAANMFENMIRMGIISPQPDQRFERVLNQPW